MKIKFIIILLFKSIINVLINYISTLFNDRDFLFKFELLINYDLDFNDDIFAHVVDFIIIFIQIKNVTKTFMIFFRNVKLSIVVKYAANECYQIFYKIVELIACE